MGMSKDDCRMANADEIQMKIEYDYVLQIIEEL